MAFICPANQYFSHLRSLCLFFLTLIYILRDTERERESIAGEGQRERETQTLKQAPGSEPSAQTPTVGLEPMICEIVT